MTRSTCLIVSHYERDLLSIAKIKRFIGIAINYAYVKQADRRLDSVSQINYCKAM